MEIIFSNTIPIPIPINNNKAKIVCFHLILGYGRVATLDILSASGLINYFGKWTDLTQIQISPILLQKGTSRLALYGLSYIKDERLSRLFRDRKASL